MKKITQIVLLIIASATSAQEKMMSYAGITNFEASIPFFEEVKAINEKTTCILITKTGQIACWINIKDFEFKRDLMQEHFNKNYMESNRFPKAIFKGKIEKFDLKNLFMGGLVGLFNFGNILFYLKAHQSFSENPSTVFAGMNMGVIIIGSLTGIFIFKEKLSKMNYVGLFLALMAIVLIVFSQK